jgi:hypothetical protein
MTAARSLPPISLDDARPAEPSRHTVLRRAADLRRMAYLRAHGFCTICRTGEAPAGYSTCEECRAIKRVKYAARRGR